MKGRILASEPHITISYDVVEDIMFTSWTGNQTKESVMDGCERMLHYLQLHRINKVLNDNTLVSGMWVDAAKWGADNWFPRMYAAGCQYFAWVYSPDVYSKLSTDKTLSYGIKGIMIATFEDKEPALAWLRVME